jgi:hypothetical protein
VHTLNPSPVVISEALVKNLRILAVPQRSWLDR